MKELELYIHIPFCVKKCGYCDFLSAPQPPEIRDIYMEQLANEIKSCAPVYADRRITTIFIGGGTPSVLSAYQVQRLLEDLGDCFFVAPDAEITIEANPGTLDGCKLKAYRKAGINRLSMGLQSADDEELRLLGRVHTFAQFLKNYDMARDRGFDNINIDIISAIPGQKTTSYEHTLRKVLECKPEHISAYSLIIEEGTPFFDRYQNAEQLRAKGMEQDLLPSEETERQMYRLTQELLEAEGYLRYEISNYALPGFSCRHNAGYWTRKDYLGLGLGAASMVENVRFSNTADIREYLSRDFAGASKGLRDKKGHVLDIQEQMEEFMFLGLRLMEGVSAEEFCRQFKTELREVYGKVIDRQIKEGLIEKTEEGVRLTDYGIDISNYVMAQYLLDS